MPVLAATLGVLGGVGGAFVGGWVANEGQVKGFTREREAAMQDLRIEAYGNFIAIAEQVDGLYLAHAPGNRSPADNKEIDDALTRLLVAKARVGLVAQGPADSDVNEAAYVVVGELYKVRETASDDRDLRP